MKKLIAFTLAVSALTVSALAAVSPEPAADAATAATEQADKTPEITAALTEAQALAAALKDAGEKEADVTVTKNKLSERTTEDGETIAVYTVRFSTDTTDYKYYVDGDTGAIIYKSVEYQNPDIVLKSHSRGDSGDRTDRASGEMDAETQTVAGSARSGRGGAHKSAAESDAAGVPADATGV